MTNAQGAAELRGSHVRAGPQSRKCGSPVGSNRTVEQRSAIGGSAWLRNLSRLFFRPVRKLGTKRCRRHRRYVPTSTRRRRERRLEPTGITILAHASDYSER